MIDASGEIFEKTRKVKRLTPSKLNDARTNTHNTEPSLSCIKITHMQI